MNLVCLNCGDRFVIDDSIVGVDGATVKCVHCGLEQPIYALRKTAPAVSPPPDVPTVPETVAPGVAEARITGSGSFRKPMSSMWAGQKGGAEPAESGDETVRMAASDLPDGGAVLEPPSLDDGSFVIGGLEPGGVEINLENSGGPFTVHSPAALALEFPDFPILDEWARSIDKPEKYSVDDSSGNSEALGDFLRKRKSGGRAAAIKNAMKIIAESPAPSLQDALTGSSRTGGRGTTVTTQFEFKVVEEKKKGPNMTVVLAILGGIIVVGVLAAALVFYFR